MFNIGDKVKRKGGDDFENGAAVLVVDSVSEGFASLGHPSTFHAHVSIYELELAVVEDRTAWHPHHDLIVAWAKGARIQRQSCGEWCNTDSPSWSPSIEYRIATPIDEAVEKLEQKILIIKAQIKCLRGQ